MLWAILNKSWWQHTTKHQLYAHLPLIMKTIQVRWTRHAGHCWRSRDELIIDVLLWTPTYGRAKVGRPARTYIQQLCEDTGCSPEDLPKAMNDREKWRERVRDIRASSTTWWWKLATIVKGDPKAPFSIATTPMCGRGHYSFPWVAPLYPWSVPYNAEHTIPPSPDDGSLEPKHYSVNFLSINLSFCLDYLINFSLIIGHQIFLSNNIYNTEV